jgi:mono/diheme cytochrome c family protein
MRMSTRIIVALVVAVLLVACSSPAATPTPEPTSAPPSTETPLPAADGEALFRTRCSSCHNLTDQPQVGPGLAGLFSRELRGQPFSEEVLAEQITKGGGGMPGFQLDAEQMNALIEYLREATQ